MHMVALTIIFLFAITGPISAQTNNYPWVKAQSPTYNIVSSIPPPSGFTRDTLAAGSFADWLRHLPIKIGNPPVYLYDGSLKINQGAHFAVVDIDVGDENLQQCADAVIRLRAEYFYSLGQYDSIHFNFTSGHNASFRKWINGYRPLVLGNKVSWHKSASSDSTYKCFRDYLNTVFLYAGTKSLEKELVKVNDKKEMKAGDVFIKGGFPGHAVIVVDMAINPKTGERVFLLAQSYMPAQEIHILKDPMDWALSPWYSLNFESELLTPEWDFTNKDLRRFR